MLQNLLLIVRLLIFRLGVSLPPKTTTLSKPKYSISQGSEENYWQMYLGLQKSLENVVDYFGKHGVSIGRFEEAQAV